MPQPTRPGEFTLLRTEVEAMGELLAHERIDRKTEVDRLTLRIEAIRKTLDELVPGFSSRYHQIHQELLQTYDPETQRDLRSDRDPEVQAG